MHSVIVLVGPTASGKTALGIALAKKFNGAVISADSRQVFAGFNIGTAKPPEAWHGEPHDILVPDNVDGIPHYLLNIKSPRETYTLSEWQRDAFAVADHLIKQNIIPIVVGGTMLYTDSFVYNFALPNVPPNPTLRAELEASPTEELYEQLIAKDPAAKQFIEPGNKRRIIRALEVIAATGAPFSTQRQRQKPRYDITFIGLFPDLPSPSPREGMPAEVAGEGWSEVMHWERLKNNIAERAGAMLRDGLLQEAKQLAARYGEDLPLLQTLNYRQALAVLQNKMTPEEALTSIIQDTNRYVRRQLSWWKNNQDITWFGNSPAAAEFIQENFG